MTVGRVGTEDSIGVGSVVGVISGRVVGPELGSDDCIVGREDISS